MSAEVAHKVIEHDEPPKPEAAPRASRAVAPRASKADVVPIASDPMGLMSLAIQRGADVATITQLNQLRMDVEKDNARKAFNLSLSAAKKAIRPIIKNRRVKFESKKQDVRDGKVDYAHEDLAGIAEQIDPILSEHGLSYYFDTENKPGEMTVICVIAHELGHEKRTPLTAGVDTSGAKNHLQAIGSAATYLQRYTLKLALGLSVTDDDDANGVGGGVGESPNRKDPEPQQRPRPPRASQTQTSEQPKQEQQTGPRKLGKVGGGSAGEWAQHYIEQFKTANTVAELVDWDKANNATLDVLYENHRPIFDETLAAFNKHKATLQAKPTASKRPPVDAEPSHDHQTGEVWDHPDPKTDYDGFLKWCAEQLNGWTTESGDLEGFWNVVIEPAGCFPGDVDDLMSLYRKAEQRLEA